MITEAATESLSYDAIPDDESREWVLAGIYALGEVTLDAGTGESGKSLRNVMIAARVAAGLAMPGEDPGTRHEPGRVLWVSSGTEDDPIFDLAPRFAAALAACAAESGLDPEQAMAARRYIHDLSAWRNGDPVFIPHDLGRLRAEAERLGELDEANRPPGHPDYAGPGPRVRFVVMDPLDALLGEGSTVDSRAGARKVMTRLGRFARGAQVAVSLICHTIGNGRKIAGSPALVNSVRLAFITGADQANPQVKVMARHKSNVARADDLRYVVATAEGLPAPFVAFLGEQAAADDAGDTLRARIAARSHDKPSSPQGFTVLRRVTPESGEPGPAEPVATRAGRGQARAAAEELAGQRLAWTAGGSGTEAAAVQAGGQLVSYAVVPG